MFTVVPTLLLFSLFGMAFEGHVDSWWCYLQAFSYLAYRMLDELDGKQARKTGNSSPLGLLFDHGCDSFTTSLLTLMIMKLVQIGNSAFLMVPLLASSMAFYFSTLEEYYIGGLYLGPGNGATDGSVLLISLFLYAGYRGNEVFKESIAIPYGPNPGNSFTTTIGYLMAYGLLISQSIAVVLK
jgi:ethanolaminephosphotransferase